MGRIRNLLPHERQARIEQMSKDEIEHLKSSEGKKFLQENKYTFETWTNMVAQQRYDGEVYITIQELRALQKDDLINHIERVLEHGLLKPIAIEEEDWEWHWSEKILFKNLKVSQLKELPQKYQLLLGFKDGKKVEINKIVDSTKRTNLNSLKKNIDESHDKNMLHGRIALFVTLSIPLLLLSMCIALPEPEKFDCYGGNLTDGEKAMCDSAFEDAYEKKWGRKPY